MPKTPWRDEDMAAYLAGRRHLYRRDARPTIEELEAILEQDEDQPLEILPNGEIRATGGSTADERSGKKPLTMREDLGGEYAQAA